MNSLKQLLLAGILVLLATAAWSQSRNERLEALKVAFITDKVGLTAAEAQTFWPIYNEFEQKRRTLKRSTTRPSEMMELDEQASKTAVQDFIKKEEQELTLKKDLVTQLEGVLSWQKIARLQAAEKAFRDELIQRLQQRKGQGARGRD